MMSPDAFFTPKLGQSLLLSGQKEIYRGQCVQSVGLFVQALGLDFPAHGFAYQYYDADIDGFDKIPAGEPIKAGDLVVWGANFPSSPGAGHIDVAAADGSINSFVGYDSNWSPPLRLSKITHTIYNGNKWISGYLRRKAHSMANVDDIRRVWLAALGHEPSQDQINENLSQDVSVMLDKVMGSDERRNWALAQAPLNRGDIYNAYQFFLGHAPNDNDYEYHLSQHNQSWNGFIYDLMKRQDLIQTALEKDKLTPTIVAKFVQDHLK